MQSIIQNKYLIFLRLILVFVWLATAIVSFGWQDTQGIKLLNDAGLHYLKINKLIIVTGALLDALLGILLLLKPSTFVYKICLWSMIAMSVIASILSPSLWLHPLGPLTKNVPIAIALLILINAKNDSLSNT